MMTEDQLQIAVDAYNAAYARPYGPLTEKDQAYWDPKVEEEKTSMFDMFGGYYAVYMDHVEMARFAPSDFWSDYASMMCDTQGWHYTWVSKT